MDRLKFITLLAIGAVGLWFAPMSKPSVITDALKRNTTHYMLNADTVRTQDFPSYFFMPSVWISFQYENQGNPLDLDSIARLSEHNVIAPWIERTIEANRRMSEIKQRYMIAHPDRVDYNFAWLPEPPKRYYAKTDPSTMKITVEELIPVDKIEANVEPVKVGKTHWLHGFKGSLQFSQAYISPNWYQGGNNNLNMLLNAIYQVKLNPAFHPDLLFENSVQYKLGVNSAPDDSLRAYSISEELLQINSKVGVRAANRWFCSLSMLFKTQLFNGYKSNTNDLKASFMSPGELNLGLGMTYNFTREDKKLQFDASISPLSYNLKTCLNRRIDPAPFGIKPGHRAVNSFGSSAETKLSWQLTRNTSWVSRVFAFTDYEYIQGDWENTFNFELNSYFSTQIYVHLRYDSHSPRLDDSRWHHWQLKEILSFGFAYRFGII